MLRKLLMVLVISAMAASFGIVVQQQVVLAAATLSVDTGTVIQSNFLGVNNVVDGVTYMHCETNSGMNSTLRNIQKSRLAGMGLKIARSEYHVWWACRNNWNYTYDWNSAEMTQFYSWLQDMKDNNIDVALTMPYYFPAECYNWGDGGGGPNDPDSLDKVAKWVSESVNQLINVKGFTNVKYLLLGTEPNTTPHNEVGGPPAGYDNWSYYKAMVQAIHNQLVADGRRSLVKLVGPNNHQDGAYSSNAANELNSYLDIYSGHEYGKSGYSGWYTMANVIKNNTSSTGKPYWVDEYGNLSQTDRTLSGYGNYIGQAVCAFINAGAQTSMHWGLEERMMSSASYHNPNTGFFMNWGLAPHITSSQVPYPAWYSFALMSKYMGGAGTQVYQTTNSNGVYIAATKQPDGNWSFLVVNGNTSSQAITVNFSGAVNKTLYRYLYDPATIVPTSSASLIGYDKTFSNVTTGFSDTIPSQAVVVYSSINGGAGLTNLAPSATLTVNSANGSYTKEKAVDENRTDATSRWISANTAVPHTFDLDWGTNKTINNIKVWSGSASGAGDQIYTYKMQSWDGSAWVDIPGAGVTNNTQDGYYGQYNNLSFTEVSTSKLRMYITDGSNIAGHDDARLFEIEVFGGMGSSAGAWIESGGSVCIEAERATEGSAYAYITGRSGDTWSSIAGYSGNAMECTLDDGDYWTDTATLNSNSPELTYKINFSTPANYNVWILNKAVDNSEDSIHIGLGNTYKFSNMVIPTSSDWKWTNVGTINSISAGTQEFNIWAREDGLMVDKIYLTSGSDTPSGTGSAESNRQ